jgi:hypothetical protein
MKDKCMLFSLTRFVSEHPSHPVSGATLYPALRAESGTIQTSLSETQRLLRAQDGFVNQLQPENPIQSHWQYFFSKCKLKYRPAIVKERKIRFAQNTRIGEEHHSRLRTGNIFLNGVNNNPKQCTGYIFFSLKDRRC